LDRSQLKLNAANSPGSKNPNPGKLNPKLNAGRDIERPHGKVTDSAGNPIDAEAGGTPKFFGGIPALPPALIRRRGCNGKRFPSIQETKRHLLTFRRCCYIDEKLAEQTGVEGTRSERNGAECQNRRGRE
jgi:hypothetical protein